MDEEDQPRDGADFPDPAEEVAGDMIEILDQVEAVFEFPEDEQGEIRVGAAAGEPAAKGADGVLHRENIIPN